RINPACPEHFRQLLSSLPLIDGIVHTWGLQQSINLTLETLEETALFSCGSALHLVQALVKNTSRPPLWIVTQGAESIQEESIQALVPSLLWGMGKTIPLEHPDLKVMRI
ncbi:MAG: hypothetical protein ACKPGB_01025, partial [Dolichospermum sp.]